MLRSGHSSDHSKVGWPHRARHVHMVVERSPYTADPTQAWGHTVNHTRNDRATLTARRANLAAISLVATMPSCKEPPSRNVPNATYVTSPKEESLIVEDARIAFSVSLDDASTSSAMEQSTSMSGRNAGSPQRPHFVMVRHT
jgi:hypothetical protein